MAPHQAQETQRQISKSNLEKRMHHPLREPHHEHRGSSPSSYFSVETFLVLGLLTLSLLVLPLILPPLPPPPSMLLLLPLGIFVVLMISAFRPSDIRNKASSHL